MAEEKKEVFDVTIESDNPEFVTAIKHGVEDEGLNMGPIFKWTGLGAALVAAIIVFITYYSQYALENANKEQTNTSTYKLSEQLDKQAETILTTYGVVDLEQGIYRIPIDEAIEKIAVD